MHLPIYQVDAFTDKLFGGNPAAVCPMATWLPDATMQAIAAENNLAETAFFVAEGDDYALRWFTPTVEAISVGTRRSRRHTSCSSFSRRNARACAFTRLRPVLSR